MTENSSKNGYAAHTPGDWVIDRRATSTAAGQRHRECTVCGSITKTEVIPTVSSGSTGGNSGGSGGSYTPSTYKPDVLQPSAGGL